MNTIKDDKGKEYFLVNEYIFLNEFGSEVSDGVYRLRICDSKIVVSIIGYKFLPLEKYKNYILKYQLNSNEPGDNYIVFDFPPLEGININ